MKIINKLFALIIIVLAICIYPTFTNQCSASDDEFLVTFHPHLDAFWLNTDDELKDINFRPAGFLYAMNQRNSKQIFNSMLQALVKNSTRKYFITEIVFFKDWYQYISENQKKTVRELLKNGQIDIANSGWVENDQAVCYYEDILDQYTIGMNWMYQQFGYVNKIGWATDSFGHSHSQVALENLLGFQFQGIQRIDDRYIYQRKQHPLLQFYWQPVSDSNGMKYGGLVNHVRHFLHEVNDLRRVSPSDITRDFKSLEKNMKSLYKKNKLFRFLGNDFEQFITVEFENLEKSMSQLNANSKCQNYKYGNPSDYVDLVKPYWSVNKLQIRQFDLMTNWDQDRYWSGYFTTDPQLKINCKQFSRLVNFVKKRLVKQYIKEKDILQRFDKVLQTAEQLIAVLQHHDGITATSKAHIETLFKQRIKSSSKSLIQTIKKIENIDSKETCQLYKNKNSCKLTLKKEKLIFSILHEGVKKTQRIELVLPEGWIYEVEGKTSYVVQNVEKSGKSIIFETQLYPGVNQFTLKGSDISNYKGQIGNYKQNLNQFDEEGIKLKIEGDKILYQFGEKWMKFSFQTSVNSPSRRQTMAWNKYGNKQDKSEGVIPGIYIMSNNGQLKELQLQLKSFNVLSFGDYHRFHFNSQNKKIEIYITLKKNDPTHLQYDLKFTPFGYNMVDYFLKVDSNIVNENSEFYHDSNGYLVSKRKIGYRPDYNWEYKKEDKINANTYPACSFFYQINQKKQKFVAFLDRALGTTTYDGAMLINIDRLAQDDYKGVGQSYAWVKQNNFKFKFAVISKDDDIERVWQRSYDDSLLGFITQSNLNKQSPKITTSEASLYLKYSLSFLNKDEILLRIHNLGERNNLKLNHFGQKQWKIDEIGLDIKYGQIKESFANGLILKERHHWIQDDEEINQINRGKNDTKNQIVLRPLEIRSFRINLKEKIVDNQRSTTSIQDIQTPEVKQIEVQEKVVLVKNSLRKRCFA